MSLSSRSKPVRIGLGPDRIFVSGAKTVDLAANDGSWNAAVDALPEVFSGRHGEAQSVIAKAQGEADANVKVAEGQAEANRKLNASLSAKVLQYIAIQKLNPKLQIAVLPAGTNALIDPSKLFSGDTTSK